MPWTAEDAQIWNDKVKPMINQLPGLVKTMEAAIDSLGAVEKRLVALETKGNQEKPKAKGK